MQHNTITEHNTNILQQTCYCVFTGVLLKVTVYRPMDLRSTTIVKDWNELHEHKYIIHTHFARPMVLTGQKMCYFSCIKYYIISIFN